MTFLAPLGLLFLLAIAVPIIIHLLDPDKGKRVFLGSIQFLEKVKQSQQPNYRIQHWLLLILRCVMIILLATLLARWVLPISIPDKTVVIVPDSWPAHFSQSQQAEFELLQSQGATIISSEANFNAIADTLAKLPKHSDKHLFLANNAASLPQQFLLSTDNTHWHIATGSDHKTTQSRWLILHAAETRDLADKVLQKLRKLQDVDITGQLISVTTGPEEHYDAILNLSAKPLNRFHYDWLNEDASVLSHYEQAGLKQPDANTHQDGAPTTYSVIIHGHQHVLFNRTFLVDFDPWLEKPWFALSMLRLLQQHKIQGTVANETVKEQLNNQQRHFTVSTELHWPLLMLFMLVWFWERLLAAKIVKEELMG